MTEVIVDNIVGLKPAYGKWVYLWWINPGERLKASMKAFRKAEEMIKSLGFKGWITSTQLEHTIMHKQIRKHGGVEYGKDATCLYFKRSF